MGMGSIDLREIFERIEQRKRIDVCAVRRMRFYGISRIVSFFELVATEPAKTLAVLPDLAAAPLGDLYEKLGGSFNVPVIFFVSP